MFGEPPAQDSLALTRDPAIYLGFLVAQESHNPRGWDEVRLGDRLVSVSYTHLTLPTKA